jgi:hypothetical protein
VLDITFPSLLPAPTADRLGAWLAQRGEPCVVDSSRVSLRALPVVFQAPDGTGNLTARVALTADLPITRLIDVLFDVSLLVGADVHLVGYGEVSRAWLWLSMIDEVDRMRLADAVRRAEEHGNKEDVLQRLWALSSTLCPGCDVRWDAARMRFVELHEETGDNRLVPVPADRMLHVVAWRWLCDAWPAVAERA